MKKTIINKYLGALSLCAAIMVAGSSCKKELAIDPRSTIDASVALSNRAGINSAINSVYASLKTESRYGRDLFSVTDAMADIGFANGRSNRLIGENRNSSGSNVVFWASSYSSINEINLILEAIPAVTDTLAGEVLKWRGELGFLRALYMFDLVRNYAYIPTFVVPAQEKGGVVINLKGFKDKDSAIAFRPSRASINDCYAQIMSDLYTAIANLSASNRGVNYASRHAALALGSRVQLYMGNWTKVDSFATASIGLSGGIGGLTSTTAYVDEWRKATHRETIFQVYYSMIAENIGVNTALQTTHTTLGELGGFTKTRQGQGDFVPNGFLLTSLGISGFPSNLVTSASTPPSLTYGNDVRAKLYEWGANASGRYVECTKWMGKNGSPNWDNTAVLRWPELYLNRAEAKYRNSDPVGAWNDLLVIKTNRIVGYTAPVTPPTGQALLDEILKERMLEYAFEGYRFFDLKRLGLNIVKSNPAVNMPATDFRILPRIPQSEIDGNPNMAQNFNY